jgi:hypothetical protein
MVDIRIAREAQSGRPHKTALYAYVFVHGIAARHDENLQ